VLSRLVSTLFDIQESLDYHLCMPKLAQSQNFLEMAGLAIWLVLLCSLQGLLSLAIYLVLSLAILAGISYALLELGMSSILTLTGLRKR
jgi:hypothetical protein